MEDKTKLINTIKEWIKLDNEIKALQKEENIRKKAKKELNVTLIEIMKDNDLDCVEIKDGSSIVYSSKTVKKPTTKKVLSGILAKFYDGDIKKAGELNEFILNNRETVIKETIERK